MHIIVELLPRLIRRKHAYRKASPELSRLPLPGENMPSQNFILLIFFHG